MRTATIADVLADHVLGETVGHEKLDESAFVVGRLEPRHPERPEQSSVRVIVKCMPSLIEMHAYVQEDKNIISRKPMDRFFMTVQLFAVVHKSSSNPKSRALP